MLILKDLINRKYVNKNCTSFEIEVKAEDRIDYPTERLFFEKICDRQWCLWTQITMRDSNVTQLYKIDYSIPKDSMPLNLIAAFGLRLFVGVLQSEVQYKSILEFSISEAIKDM